MPDAAAPDVSPRVYFIGAGPGDPDLLTVKASRLIATADLVLYAGSLVSPGIVALAKPAARVVDSAPLALDETHALMAAAARAGKLVARVHTGDPALYGAIAEQAALLAAEHIPYAVIPGVTSASAAAAAFAVSFTVPEITQTLILTRLAGRTPMPPGETLADLARHRSAMAVYLSAGDPEGVAQALLDGGYPPETPVALAHRLGWPGEKRLWATIATLAETVRREGIDRQTVFLILPGLGQATTSKLYDATFGHACRPARS
ncbi:precorrin-4 C(11)-methyltransferase [Desulfovibrio sp. TomC]|uniref:precorrin-4 C(11)-methyltransferase n=1 Tax=Desulfovibrio sp. TomC TaxID=1562888 RepID=UPI00057480EE|nr:precorrin-4 C(11)-methyltransferase [Desulfovibrio sp. TomC]KHK03178.1 Cobalt-precorrin-4 C11-methyltransferase [Desulfovibrio sp. TomC]